MGGMNAWVGGRGYVREIGKDALFYGVGMYKVGCRKWWNPMRFFRGWVYIKRIDVRTIYK